MVPTGLLKGIDPLLTADLLYVLRLAGHDTAAPGTPPPASSSASSAQVLGGEEATNTAGKKKKKKQKNEGGQSAGGWWDWHLWPQALYLSQQDGAPRHQVSRA